MPFDWLQALLSLLADPVVFRHAIEFAILLGRYLCQRLLVGQRVRASRRAVGSRVLSRPRLSARRGRL